MHVPCIAQRDKLSIDGFMWLMGSVWWCCIFGDGELCGWRCRDGRVGGAFGGTRRKVGWVGVVVFTLGIGI